MREDEDTSYGEFTSMGQKNQFIRWLHNMSHTAHSLFSLPNSQPMAVLTLMERLPQLIWKKQKPADNYQKF